MFIVLSVLVMMVQVLGRTTDPRQLLLRPALRADALFGAMVACARLVRRCRAHYIKR
jgi:hypothetical protein